MVGAYFANSGQAGAVKVEIGDKVKKGQLLATLTGSESTVKDLQKELESQIAENAETNASSQSKIEQLNIELKAVKKQKKQAKNTKDKNNRLYSPVNGEVIAKNLAPGDFVTGGVSVITIADMDKTQIRTEYIGSSVLDRASGYQAVINGKKYKVTAQEQDVSQMDVEMGNLPTSTYFDYEKDANVSVGDSVTLEFYNNATEDALVVPSNAVFKAKSEHYVYRMDGDAKKKVKVTLGTKTDAYTQIMSGLKEGDVVYVQD
jgi:HlyD family secretion protein